MRKAISPIVLLVFNRPKETQIVFDQVRQVKPSTLFVVADGPRSHKFEDTEKCRQVRDIFDQIDWVCDLKTNYAEQNLGCQKRVSSGLSWVFDQVEEAIILEDDCVPNLSFFQFCDELLERYRDDTRIMSITGDNFQYGTSRTENSYYYSIFNHCWGWASWKRAWKYYDDPMTYWPHLKSTRWLIDIMGDKKSAIDWSNRFHDAYNKKTDSWAMRWTYSCWLQSGLSIIPDVNLVSNIGVSDDATHTKNSKGRSYHMSAESMSFPLQHPTSVLRHFEADKYTNLNHFGSNVAKHYARRLLRILKK